jgi:hypothetical protein
MNVLSEPTSQSLKHAGIDARFNCCADAAAAVTLLCRRLTFGLTDVRLDTNSITGAIPPEMGVLENLHEIDLRNSSMSCLGTLANAAANTTANSSTAEQQQPLQQCEDSHLLPCFLFFSKELLPRTDSSNMACPVIMRRFKDEAVQACAGDGVAQLGEQAGNIADLTSAQQAWDVDPSYYQFRPCRCLEVRRAKRAAAGVKHTHQKPRVHTQAAESKKQGRLASGIKHEQQQLQPFAGRNRCRTHAGSVAAGTVLPDCILCYL